MARIIDAFTQFFDDNGDPLVNGWLKFNESGTNNTDKTTYADINESIPNTNPLQLDGAGRCPNVFGPGSYNVISFADDVVNPGQPGQQIQQFDPVGGTNGEGDFRDWAATEIYSVGDIVTASNGRYYRSLSNDNENNEPSSSPTQWEEVTLNQIWNENVTYGLSDTVYASDGLIYISRISSNIGNDPTTSPDEWESYVGRNEFVKNISLDIKGLTLSNNTTDPNNDIDFAQGSCVDIKNLTILETLTGFTKQLDAAWSVGTDQGGLFAGVKAADTWYHCFIIKSDIDGSIDAGFDTSVMATNIPLNYTAYRRIGSILTDSLSNIRAFLQYGNEFMWIDPPADVDDSSTGTTAKIATISTPLGIRTIAQINAHVQLGSSNMHGYITSVDQVDNPAAANSIYTNVGITAGGASSVNHSNTLRLLTNRLSQIRYRTSASGNMDISVHSYTDLRIE